MATRSEGGPNTHAPASEVRDRVRAVGSRVPEAREPEDRVHEHKLHTHTRASLRLVLVRWHDAWFDLEQPTGGWRDDYLVQTVGFLVRESSDVISVAQELLPWRDGFRAVTHIPLGIVESVTTLFHDEEPARRAGDRQLRGEA